MDNFTLDSNEIKSHTEIDSLINEVKSVEHQFENLDFLKDLPIDIPIEQPEIFDEEKPLEPEPPQFVEQSKQIDPNEIPKEINDRMPQKEFKAISSLHTIIHNKLLYPVLKTPEVGHTTFTLQINENKLEGFYLQPKETKDIKDIISDIKSRIHGVKEKISNLPSMLKGKIKEIKEKGIKNELKNLPNKIITPIKNIKIDTIKNIPKQIRNLLSSDKQ